MQTVWPLGEVICLPALTVSHIQEKYQAKNGEVEAIADVSFTMEKGEFLSIVGPSGCGKSTLLSMLAGLLTPTGGEILIGHEPVRGISPYVGYMLQKDNLLPWRSIYRNVLLGLEIRHQLTEENIASADRLLHTYGLWEFKDKYPAQLSGGMRQRVALIRTLAINPKVLLLDEAFSALDYQTRLSVTEDVYAILHKEGITTVMVTHDIPESISMGDRVLILTARPARVKEIVTLDFGKERTPLSCRNSPRFQEYFDHIWKELGVHE